MGTRQNKETALVTGASTGIGYELARVLAANGHPLVIVARDREKLNALAGELQSEYGVPVGVFARDLSEPGAAEALWSEVSGSKITIDILVNNAGVGAYGEFQNMPLAELERMQMLNVVALTSLTRLALPEMLARKHGRVLNVASVVGYQPGGPRMAAYYATKAYVLSFSKGVARELDGSGVSVTVLSPGPTETSFDNTAGAKVNVLYNRLPKMTAAVVARAGYDGMKRQAMVVIPGFLT